MQTDIPWAHTAAAMDATAGLGAGFGGGDSPFWTAHDPGKGRRRRRCPEPKRRVPARRLVRSSSGRSKVSRRSPSDVATGKSSRSAGRLSKSNDVGGGIDQAGNGRDRTGVGLGNDEPGRAPWALQSLAGLDVVGQVQNDAASLALNRPWHEFRSRGSSPLGATTSSYRGRIDRPRVATDLYSILPLSYDASESKIRLIADFRRFFTTVRERPSRLTGWRTASLARLRDDSVSGESIRGPMTEPAPIVTLRNGRPRVPCGRVISPIMANLIPSKRSLAGLPWSMAPFECKRAVEKT